MKGAVERLPAQPRDLDKIIYNDYNIEEKMHKEDIGIMNELD